MQQWQQRWNELEPGKRKVILIMLAATLLTGFGSTILVKARGAMSPLYAGLPATETREIAAELSRMGIDYKTSTDETSISVPSRDEARARMKLAGAGLPRSTPEKGWEIFGEGGLAVTKPQQQAMQIRALQGELSRSIASLDNVTKAAVHISLKRETPFLSEQEPAKAAVLLHLKPGTNIARETAMSIAYLVAKSVPDLETAQVTIMDEKGVLLFSDNVAIGSGEADGKSKAEKEIERRVQSQLDMTFGLGKAIARVTATMKNERSEVRKTSYSPANNGRDGVPAKETSETEDYSGTAAAGGAQAGGVPGAAANLFGNQTGGGGGNGPGGRYTKNKTDRDYKVNEEQVVTVKPGGGVDRLTLGIFVDESLQSSLPKIETVARNAAGIDEKRGDSLSVEAVKFSGSNVDSLMGTARAEMVKTIARLILNALALIIGLLTLRSIIAALKPQGEAASLDALGATYDLAPALGGLGQVSLTSPAAMPQPLLTAAGAPVGAGAAGITAPGVPAHASFTGQPAAGGVDAAEGGGIIPLLSNSEGGGLSGVLVPGSHSTLFSAQDDSDFDPDYRAELTGPTPEEMIGRVENSQIDDIAEVLRHWLEGDLDG